MTARASQLNLSERTEGSSAHLPQVNGTNDKLVLSGA